MPVGAVGLLVVLSVESFKASSRFLHKRKSKKHGYSSLRTDSLGRPISEDGKRLSKNEAKALAAHNKEIERIRTAEREWRAKGERLPAYAEMDNEAIIQSLRRPSTAPASGRSSSSNSRTSFHHDSVSPICDIVPVDSCPRQQGAATRPRAVSMVSSTPLDTHASSVRAQREARLNSSAAGRADGGDLAISTFQSLDNGGFAIRRRTQTLVLPSIPSSNDSPEIEDIFQHDGFDWRRATWEAPPLYDRVPSQP